MHISFSVDQIANNLAQKLCGLSPDRAEHEAEISRVAYNVKQVAWNVTTVALAAIATLALCTALPVGVALVLGGAFWLVRQALADDAEGRGGLAGMAGRIAGAFGVRTSFISDMGSNLPENWDPVALEVAGVHVWRNLLPAAPRHERDTASAH
mgnify:CR=1 FL=1